MEPLHKNKQPRKKNGLSKNIIENPFKDPKDDSDVLIKVGEHTLHVHSWVLAHYSLTFRKWLDNNFKGPDTEITIKDSTIAHVIDLVKFFYPQMHHSLNGIYSL